MGPWLAASKELGDVDILGIDGYGDNGILMVPSDCFRRADLTNLWRWVAGSTWQFAPKWRNIYRIQLHRFLSNL